MRSNIKFYFFYKRYSGVDFLDVGKIERWKLWIRGNDSQLESLSVLTVQWNILVGKTKLLHRCHTFPKPWSREWKKWPLCYLRIGFLCLESSSDCALDEKSSLPLHHWTTSQSQIDRIQRLFSFGDFLSYSDVILWTRLFLLLIKYIKYNRDEKDRIQSLLHDLRQTNVPSRASCIVSVRAEQAETWAERTLFRSLLLSAGRWKWWKLKTKMSHTFFWLALIIWILPIFQVI